MNVLVTSSRMPFALDEIRKFGAEGHEVYAADTFRTAPGSHAHAVVEHFVVPSPTYDTLAFVDRIEAIVAEHGIDLVVPGFEDVFFLAKHRDRLDPLTTLFCPDFETLARFHDKASFQDLCRQLDVTIPATTTVTDDAGLHEAIDALPAYFARASFTRGGMDLLTNTGPLAGALAPEDCHPSPENPWIVQQFVRGTDLCSFSVAHRGRVSAHCTYAHPRTIEHSSGIVFDSVVEPRTLAAVESFVAATAYTGQVSFDFLAGDDGDLYLIECNPRPTDGESLFAPDELVDAIVAPADDTFVLPAGRETQIDMALVRDMVKNWHDIPADVETLIQGSDLYHQKGDVLPGLYQFLSYSHVLAMRHHLGTAHHSPKDIMEAQFYDISWNGEPIP